VVKAVIKELNLNDKLYRPQAMHGQISKCKNELIAPAAFEARTYWEEVAGRIYVRYQELLRANNALDFDDLLMETALLLRDNAEVRSRYQERFLHLLVDEFQDTNVAQYELVKLLLGPHRNLFCVADEDQSIYAWRGADPRNIKRLRDDFPDMTQVLLERNYRSTQIILDAANEVIKHNWGRTPKKLFTERSGGPLVTVYQAYDEIDEANFVVDEIARLTSGGGIEPGDCVVLYRTNAQSRALEDAFVRRNLPYRLVGATRFYERKEIKDAIAYLRLVHNAPTLLTLHAAKGLEFPIVFITGLEEGILPHSRSLDEPEELEEERRLFYVGLTRAEDRVYLLYSFRRTAFGQSDLAVPSRFLADIPDDLTDGLNVSRQREETVRQASSWSWNQGASRQRDRQERQERRRWNDDDDDGWYRDPDEVGGRRYGGPAPSDPRPSRRAVPASSPPVAAATGPPSLSARPPPRTPAPPSAAGRRCATSASARASSSSARSPATTKRSPSPLRARASRSWPPASPTWSGSTDAFPHRRAQPHRQDARYQPLRPRRRGPADLAAAQLGRRQPQAARHRLLRRRPARRARAASLRRAAGGRLCRRRAPGRRHAHPPHPPRQEPAEYTLVSSDRAIIAAAEKRRMPFRLAQDFAPSWPWRARRPPPRPPPATDKPMLSEAEVAAWMELFGPEPELPKQPAGRHRRRRRPEEGGRRRQQRRKPHPSRRPTRPGRAEGQRRSPDSGGGRRLAAGFRRPARAPHKKRRKPPEPGKPPARHRRKRKEPRTAARPADALKASGAGLSADEVDEWLDLFAAAANAE
jgi:hypothetical protein